MTNEQEYINNLIGKENHFKVPDGYFDRLTAEIMEKLPGQESCTGTNFSRKNTVMRPWLAAASIAAVIAISATLYFNRNSAATEGPVAQTATAAATADNDSYIEEAADYMMIDHGDIYACLSSEY